MARKILIVDDNELNREMLRDALCEDYEVLEAENGKVALRMMHQSYRTLSAVLLDIEMPEMDGLEVLRRIQANPMLSRIPVIVTTSSAHVDMEIEALSLGASDFVAKPYNLDILSHRLKNTIHLQEMAVFISAMQKDKLTGIYNREAFFSTAAGMINAKSSGFYVLACFDIDKFKVINDQYGSMAGDEVLKHVARVFSNGFAAIGGICGRIMADDFAVLYPREFIDSDALAQIRHKASLPGGDVHAISFSIGRYVVDDLTLPVSSMYDRALLAQAAAKGRYENNIATYDESMRERLLREQRITSEMRTALETDQFEVWFQPLYNHHTRALIGAEALVRWRRPEEGSLIPPGEFVPVFERNGFIYEMDKYVWEKACQRLRSWIDEGLSPLPVSVNISRYDVLQKGFLDTLTGLVEKYGLPVDMLRVEITESAFAEASNQIISVVKSLLAYGFTVEIDDFGSGYSSLNTLKDVPAQILKLDMRFLENTEDSDRGGNVLESIVRMAKWLGMAVIAEGVETVEQADYLKSIGCIYVQGYLYAKPMPVDQFEALLKGADKEARLLAMETVKNLDNNAFWDAKSMDTLIFNSYVGAACIMEYSSGHVELLRVSDMFMQMLGSDSLTAEDALKVDWRKHFSEESRAALWTSIQTSMETGGNITGEYLFENVPGCPERVYMRITLRVIANTGNSYLVYCLNENITAQKESEAKERASTEQLQAIMANINGSVTAAVVRDGIPEFLFVNEQFYSMHGYTREQYIAEVGNTPSHIYSADRERLMQRILQASVDGKPFSEVYRIVRRDGTLRWLQSNIAIINLPGVEDLVQLSVTSDITELREAEDKERASAEQLQAIMDNINGGVMAAVVEHGRTDILFANEQFYRLFGYTEQQYRQEVKNAYDRLHPSDFKQVVHQTSVSRQTGQPFSAACRVVRRDGSTCWLQTNIAFIRRAGIDAPVQLVIATDITDRKELEEKERANAVQLQAIMDNINGGVAVADIRDGAPHILFSNEHFYQQLGYTKEQFEQEVEDGSQIIHPDDRERFLRTVSTTDKPFSIVYRIVRRDNAVRWLQNNITFVRLLGYDELVQLSVSNDITELREAERKEYEVSERLQAILGALNSGVSGVIMKDGKLQYVFANDMYYAMLGYTREQFESEVQDGFDPVHPDDIDRVREEIERLYITKGNKVLEYRAIRRDGETIHMRVNVSMIALDGVDGLVNLGVSTDITDIVKAQQRISELSDLMQAVMGNVSNGISATVVDGRKVEYLFCNDRYFEMHGFTREQYAAEVPVAADLIHPDDRQRILADTAEVNEIGKRTTLEYRVIRRDGAVRWMRAAISVQGFASSPRPVQFTVYSDITDEKLAQEKQRAQNEQLQTMMNDMPGGFARLRVLPDGNVATEYVNEYFCRMRGLTREAIMTDDSQDAMHTVHPDDWEMVRAVVGDMVATGKAGNVRYRLKHADGSYIPCSVFGRVTTGDDGTKYINVYYADMTAQERKEISIHETLPHVLSAILASSTALAFAKDKDFRYICGSSEFMKMTNCAHENEIIGKTDYEIFPREIADILRRNDSKLLETGMPMLDYVQALPLSDGSLHHYKISKYVLRDGFGNILGVYGIGRDITEEKDAYARLKLLVDSIPGGIASYAATPHGIRITYFNDGFCNMLGYTREEYEKISATGITNITHPEDVPRVMEQAKTLIQDGTPLNCTYRVHVKGGGYKWVNLRGSVAEKHDDICFINAVLYDVTERMEAENALRLSEEELRIAASIGGRTVARYDIKTGAYQHNSQFLLDTGFASRVENAPQAFIDSGLIAPDCIVEYLAFYDKLRRGESPCSVDIAIVDKSGAWRWLRESATVMKDADGTPSRAIIVFSDITELREKEAIFRKWQQSLQQRPAETYMLFRCNLSKEGSLDSAEGKLFWIPLDPDIHSFNGRTQAYANRCVHQDDRAEYIAFLNADSLLANYYRGVHTKTLEYRQTMRDGTLRWLRLTVELVEYPNSKDVEAFLLYEDIDAAKREEMRTRELAETDPLTGVLNRAAFSLAVDRIVSEPSHTESLAILMLDIDAFKQINDTLGHDMGDKVLKDTADALRGVLRRDDLLGRLGGDEFLICLRDIHDDEIIGKKAEQICSLLNKTLRSDVHTSTSIGIAICPRDGKDFVTLYRKADTALYRVKSAGKNNYAFYDAKMSMKGAANAEAPSDPAAQLLDEAD